MQYVLEGSVRKAGNRVRVTAQLIDAEPDRHIWAERYDRELADIFAIQDELTAAIVAVLPGRVEAATRDRAARKTTANMAAYECALAGKLLHHRSNRADNVEALRQIERAIALDPNYAHAHAWRACILGQAWVNGWSDVTREAARETIAAELRIAQSLDDNDSDVHRIFAALYLAFDDHEKAVYHQARALSLNPNDDLIVVQQGEILTWLGQPEEGIDWIKKAMRLNPYHPERFWGHLGRAYFVARRYAEAIDALRRITAPDPGHLALLAACHAELGNAAAAAEHRGALLKRAPELLDRGSSRDPALQARRGSRASSREPRQGRAAARARQIERLGAAEIFPSGGDRPERRQDDGAPDDRMKTIGSRRGLRHGFSMVIGVRRCGARGRLPAARTVGRTFRFRSAVRCRRPTTPRRSGRAGATCGSARHLARTMFSAQRRWYSARWTRFPRILVHF